MPPSWNFSPKQAIALQKELASQVDCTDRFAAVRQVAGVDVGFEQGNTITRAAVAVLNLDDLSLQYGAIARLPTTFPYVPGLLSFRELPAILAALEKLPRLPDLLLCDGQGIAHPRRLGIASHLGLLLDRPTIGVAKSRLVGAHDEPPPEKGGWMPLQDKGETIGAVLRTRRGVKPLYISPGHRISLETSMAFVMQCITRYRLPETTRWAHRLASGDLAKLPPNVQLIQ